MNNKEFLCIECDAEFTIEYDGIDTPLFCPFCSTRLNYDDSEIEEDWEDDEFKDRGC